MIRSQEQEKYDDAWMLNAYHAHSPGKMVVRKFLEMTSANPATDTILDAGCGAGAGAVALIEKGFSVRLCDFSVEGFEEGSPLLALFRKAILWDDLAGLGSFDYVYCCDVMEHIPPQFTMLAVARMLAITRKAVFFSISLVPDNNGYLVGKPLHQTVMPFVWWRDNLIEVGKVTKATDLLHSALFVVVPR